MGKRVLLLYNSSAWICKVHNIFNFYICDLQQNTYLEKDTSIILSIAEEGNNNFLALEPPFFKSRIRHWRLYRNITSYVTINTGYPPAPLMSHEFLSTCIESKLPDSNDSTNILNQQYTGLQLPPGPVQRLTVAITNCRGCIPWISMNCYCVYLAYSCRTVIQKQYPLPHIILYYGIDINRWISLVPRDFEEEENMSGTHCVCT